MKFRVALLILVLMATSCGGDDTLGDDDEVPETSATTTTAGPTTTAEPDQPVASDTAPPWGLDDIEMPDSPEAVAAAFAILPAELNGMPRIDMSGRIEGSLGVEYGEAISVRATPLAAIAAAVEGEPTAMGWLETMSRGLDGEVEGVALDENAPLGWIASAEQADDETVYLAAWCVPDGSWYFDVVADTPEARLDLIHSFIEAVTQASF